MKKIHFLGALLCFISTFAQTNPLDKQLERVDQSSVTSGIIYERSSRMANLYEFNQVREKPHNTADFRFFEKAMAELYKASNQKKLVSTAELEKRLQTEADITNVVNIGIINTPFQILNYNPEKPEEGGLILKDSVFEQIPNRVPFYTLYALVVAPLKNVVVGKEITYKFRDDLIFNANDSKIASMTADFGDGQTRTIIEKGVLVTSSITLANTERNGDKQFTFIVALTNGYKVTTRGSIYTHYPKEVNGICNTDSNDPIANFKATNLVATDAYQGLNESMAITSEIEARVFYHNYNNAAHQKTLLKPVIIIDGFDPGDGRKMQDCDCENDLTGECQEAHKSKITHAYDPTLHTSMVELMAYVDKSVEPNENKNLIKLLRDAGYDVILVNQPTYYSNHNGTGAKVDGGADFIERNAMALVELIKEVNTKLTQNGSAEQLVVVGPSMGGQISRYALAFMEKKYAETNDPQWQHNTRIWVAFDSPNHGANIPMGDQALISLVSDDSPEAKKMYDYKLNSTVAKELLIDLHQNVGDNNVNGNYLNGSTTAQGMPINAGNPYFQAHYNNQFNNGLPNSKGFPMNVRKLAVVNGSLSGASFGSNSQNILDVRLFTQICFHLLNPIGDFFGGNPDIGPTICYTTKLAEMQSWTVPASGNYARIAYNRKFLWAGASFNTTNLNNRGNMDIVSGGSVDATNTLYASITGYEISQRSFWQYTDASLSYWYANIFGNGAEWEKRALVENQCFIPTYSSIGIKNPNQNWSNPLNRNLVCSNETYFDSYFGEAENSEHVALNYRSVKWLMKELGDSTNSPTPQPPSYPIEKNSFIGPETICLDNTTVSYSFGDVCKIPSPATFTVSDNLEIVGTPSATEVIVRGTANGEGTITVHFQDSDQTVVKKVWVGLPDAGSITCDSVIGSSMFCSGQVCHGTMDLPEFSVDSMVAVNNVSGLKKSELGQASNYIWERINDNILISTLRNKCYIAPNIQGLTGVRVKVHNTCGWSEWSELYFNIVDCGYNYNKSAQNLFRIFPNPTSDVVNVMLADENKLPVNTFTITAELFDMMQQSKGSVSVLNNTASINVAALPKGIYVLKIYIDGTVEYHQVAVQ